MPSKEANILGQCCSMLFRLKAVVCSLDSRAWDLENFFIRIFERLISEYFSHVVLGLNFWKTLASFHINARKQFNNNLTFDFTGYSSKIVEVLLDGLHFEIPGLPTAVKNLPDMLELILFLLDDGKIR